MVTSGDYQSFLVIDGRRYGHILDPRTGYPAAHLRSVTVVCPDAELADALATTLVSAVLFAAGLSAGCATVEPWQKGTLAEGPMQVDDDRCHRFERNIEVYREGAAGGNSGKAGGGCGCS